MHRSKARISSIICLLLSLIFLDPLLGSGSGQPILGASAAGPAFPAGFLRLTASLPLPSGYGLAGSAQTPPPENKPDAATSDYLADPLRLLFPSAPASLDLSNTDQAIFANGTPGFDLFALGVLSSAESTTTTALTKTLTLELGGGFRGRVFASPAWLDPLPDRFINPQGQGKLQIEVKVRQDAGQGAGLLPGQTNWGRLLLSLNGTLFDYAVPLLVPAPNGVGRAEGEGVFTLYRHLTARLDAQGDLDALIGSPAFPNGGQFALGLIVDYLGEKEYNGRLPQLQFLDRVAETLAAKDYNADGWIGFKPEDVVIGAPGWALGKKTK